MKIPSRMTNKGRCITGNRKAVYLVNETDAEWAPTRYLFQFGAYGSTWLLVWGTSIESALESAAEWLREHEPGHFVDVDSDEEPDVTYTESGWLLSYEWWVSEVTRSDLMQMVA